MTSSVELPPYCRPYSDKQGRKGSTLYVRAQPRSSRSGPLGIVGAQLKWGVNAAPDGGEANRELLKSIAKHVGVTVRRVNLLRGETSRSKVVLVEGLDAAELAARL